MEDKEFSLTLFGGAGNSNALTNTNPENELVNKFPIDPQMNCIILLNGGKLFIEDALLSLKFFFFYNWKEVKIFTNYLVLLSEAIKT